MANQTNKLIVICVECNKQSQTDKIYIGETIKKYYNVGNTLAIRYCEMGTKTKYNRIQKKITQITKNAPDVAIIMCVDTDDIFSSQETVSFNKKITEYCQTQGYDLVWFCQDIEEVFLHKTVSDTDKQNKAQSFKTNPSVCKATRSSLSVPDPIHHKQSNLLCVLDNHLNGY